jgi:hypothetical protein
MINPFESSAFDMTSLTASINLLPKHVRQAGIAEIISAKIGAHAKYFR